MISDTHDLLRPEVVEAIRDVDQILHCGDVCSPEILEELEGIAPVLAVRGNCDHGDWAHRLPARRTEILSGWKVHMVHDRADFRADPVSGVDLVLFGHSHKPTFEEAGPGPVFINPGSAGPRRFELPIAVALLRLYEEYFGFEQLEWEVR